ncbi:UNVERIFIED_CONTAM: hypothetical protein FKN15_027224 [Acipenser sinensis]
MAAGTASTPAPSRDTALCAFPLAELDGAIVRAQELCYVEEGRSEEAYIEYEVNSQCTRLSPDSVSSYPCGYEHTPSPIASSVPVETTPAVTMETQLSAVAATTEEGHTIVLLGDSQGQLHKVFLQSRSHGEVYSSETVQPGSPVSADLLLDNVREHVYVMTAFTVSKLPVSSCARHTDCGSCLAARDPHCGCCTRKAECERFEQANHWLWSYRQGEECIAVQRVSPANRSRDEPTERLQPIRGPDSCPCTSGILGSSLVPVGFETQLILEGKNLDLFEDPAPDYHCVLEIGEASQRLPAKLNRIPQDPASYHITCQSQQYHYSVPVLEYTVPVYLQRGSSHRIDSRPDVNVTLYNCSVGQSDCSRCKAGEPRHSCVWCGGEQPGCVYRGSCRDEVVESCPDPIVHSRGLAPLLIQRCVCRPRRIVCAVSPSVGDTSGPVRVIVGDREPAVSTQVFTYQNPELTSVFPEKGPVAGGTSLTINGIKLKTGQPSDVTAFVGHVPCEIVEVEDTFLVCRTDPANQTEALPVRVLFGQAERTLGNVVFHFRENPVIAKTNASKSFYSGGRVIQVSGRNLDVVQNPLLQVWAEPSEGWGVSGVLFVLDNLRVPFSSVGTGEEFLYHPDPVFKPLTEDTEQPYHFKPGSVIMVEGTGLTLAMTRAEVSARVGDADCAVKTLDDVHLYCEPPPTQPASLQGGGALPDFIRDRGYVASLLTMALHGKMEYLTDIMKTLLGDLVELYVAKNPKLMLRRTETVVEKLLSNWMSICLYSFLRWYIPPCLPAETAMLEDGEEGGLKLWHLVKSAEEPEVSKHRKSSLRERERAKAVPEIFLTRLLSMKGTLQKFVDDVFQAILNTSRPVPIAVRYFFDFLDEVAEKHGIEDKETVHIWKTNSLPLRFWVNILKNPQFILDVQVPNSVDAVLSVIAQTFIDSCTTSEHKVGRVIMALEEDPTAQKMQLAYRLQQVAAFVENKVTDL